MVICEDETEKEFSSFPTYCKNLMVRLSIHEYILRIIKHLTNSRKGYQNREAGLSECHPNSSHDKRSQGWVWNYASLHVWAVFCLLVLASPPCFLSRPPLKSSPVTVVATTLKKLGLKKSCSNHSPVTTYTPKHKNKVGNII